MISCDFYLNNRIKTITGENIMSCWKTFNTDFGEAVTEIVKVKVIEIYVISPKEAREHYYSPEQFKALLKK